MKRWKLWTAIASSVLSVGSGTTYVVWDRVAGPKVALAADPREAEEKSPYAEPPRPIPDSSGGWSQSPGQFVSQASFDGDPAGEPPAGDVQEAAPPPPSASRFGPPTGVDFRSTFEVPQPLPRDPSSTQATLSDEPSPEAEIPAPPVPVPSGGVDSRPLEEAPPADQPDAGPAPMADVPPPGGFGLGGQSPATGEPEPVVPEPPSYSSVPAGPPPTLPDRGAAEAIEQGLPSGTPLRPDLIPSPPPADPPGLPPATRPASPAPFPGSGLRSTPPAFPGSAPAAAPDNATGLTSNSPGERQLEGLQAPSLTVERSAPEEIRVGAPARFVIRVKNVGDVAAHDVMVSDRVPQGTRLLSATPEVSPGPDGRMTWELGVLAPGQLATINLELLPETEGEIGSVAAVTFRAQAAVRTIATRPLLKVEHTGPAKTLIGEDIPLQITVSNPGSGAATGVVIEVDVPKGLSHDGGREIMSDRFDLRPNEARTLDLVLRASEPGPVQTVVRAVGDYNLRTEFRGQLEVIAPALQVAVVGPTRRFLDRPVKYQIPIRNAGTAAAHDVELVARLPRGLKFVSADKKGQYDERVHAVFWSLEELPAGEQGLVELTAVPADTGEQKLRVEARAALAVDQQFEHTMVVEDITDLVFTVTDENIPIEVGSDTTYQIRIANNGTKAARNIRLSIQTPPGLEIIDFDGPATPLQQGDRIETQAIPELGQNEEAVFRISAKGIQPGDHVLRVQLFCDEFSTPVTKEEITKVYADQ